MNNKVLNKDEQQFLNDYNPAEYEKPSVTVDNLIFSIKDNHLQILLIKRGGYPYKDCWAIPGGFVEINESLEEAAERELYEETNLKDIYLEQLYTFGNVDRDPRMRVISVAYMALVPRDKLKVNAGDDAAEAEIFDVLVSGDRNLIYFQNKDKNIFVSSNDLAFDHSEIIRIAIERLRGKISYTNIAFSLLKDKDCFTIFELKKIHEIILGKKLDLPNFRRSFKREFIDTNKVAEVGQTASLGKRMSTAYKLL